MGDRWGDKKVQNIHVGHGKTKEDFIKSRNKRDATLAMPKLFIPSLQVNMRAGEVSNDKDGNPVLKFPLKGLRESNCNYTSKG